MASHESANTSREYLDAFYRTFKVKEGDKMYRPPRERVSIW